MRMDDIWYKTVPVVCLVISAVVQAAQQALTSSPTVATRLPPLTGIWNYVPLSLLCIAGVLWVVGLSRAHKHAQGQPPALSEMQAQSLIGAPSQPAKFDAATFFRHSYHSPMESEIGTNMRRAAIENQPDDREGFYLKFIAIGYIAYTYDAIWYSIYRSQLLALLELNRNDGLLPLSAIKTFYDQAAITYPSTYINYPFDTWMDYMKLHILVIQHPSDMIEITVQGKDVLKYLLHWGREADKKSL